MTTDAEGHKRFLGHFLKNREGLSAFIWVMVGDRHQVEEILQETSVVLWEKFDTFREDSSFGAWARQVALNVTRNARRKLSKAPRPLSEETARAIADAFDRTEGLGGEEEWRGALENCLQRLPASWKQLIDNRYFKDEGLSEMAGRLGRSMAGVNAALCKARAALETCLRRSLGKEAGLADPS